MYVKKKIPVKATQSITYKTYVRINGKLFCFFSIDIEMEQVKKGVPFLYLYCINMTDELFLFQLGNSFLQFCLGLQHLLVALTNFLK